MRLRAGAFKGVWAPGSVLCKRSRFGEKILEFTVLHSSLICVLCTFKFIIRCKADIPVCVHPWTSTYISRHIQIYFSDGSMWSKNLETRVLGTQKGSGSSSHPHLHFFCLLIWERDTHTICCATCFCIHYFLVCALTRDQTHTLGELRGHSKQLNYLARAKPSFDKV